jgi:plasmid stabilization system protein ParE
MATEFNRIAWSLAAQRDLIDIWQYLARASSPQTADKLVDEIEFAADRLSLDPRMNRVRRDLMPDLPGGLRSAPVRPYTIYYRMQQHIDAEVKGVQILRVIHERRDAPATLANIE